MNFLYGFLVVLHVFVCLFLMLVILLQAGKGSGLSGLMGSGGDMFGGQGVEKPLSILTAIIAGLFLVTTLSLSYLSTQGPSSRSVTDDMKSRTSAPASTAVPTQAPAAAPVQQQPVATPSK